MNVHEIRLRTGPLTVSIVSDGRGGFTTSASAHIETIEDAEDVDLSPAFTDRAFRRSFVVGALLVGGAASTPVVRSDFCAALPGDYDDAMLRTKGMCEVDSTPVTLAGSPEGVRYGLLGLTSARDGLRYLGRQRDRHGIDVVAAFTA